MKGSSFDKVLEVYRVELLAVALGFSEFPRRREYRGVDWGRRGLALGIPSVTAATLVCGEIN